MKIVKIDKDTTDDSLVADHVEQYWVKIICDMLNNWARNNWARNNWARNNPEDYVMVKSDDYELHTFKS